MLGDEAGLPELLDAIGNAKTCDAAVDYAQHIPVRLIARDRFASVERMDSIAMPKLHLHATKFLVARPGFS